MLHPFASLKALYQNLGANSIIPMSDMTNNYSVNSAAFVNTQFPVDATTPTKTVTRT